MITEGGTLLLIFVVLPIVALWIAATLHVLFRRPDLSVMWKAIWIGIVLVIPTVGVLFYLSLRPRHSFGRSTEDGASAPRTAVDEVNALIARHDAGEMGDDEYGRRKAEIFGLV